MAGKPDDDLVASITELQSLLLSTPDIEAFLQEVAVLAVKRVSGDGLSCEITVRVGGRPLTVTSGAIATRMGEDQDPCLRAMRTGQPVRINDTGAAREWGYSTMRAAANGIGSVLSLPLAVEGRHIGVLNLYGSLPDALGPAQTRRAERLAASAAPAVALAVRQAATADLTDHFRAALASRAVIDQALGVIIAQNRCTTNQAFRILRTASQNRNVKLHDVAATIVTSVSGEPPQPSPFRVLLR